MLVGATSYFVKPPPMPPYKTNGVYVPWEDIFGPLPLTEIVLTPQYVLSSGSEGINLGPIGVLAAGQTTTIGPIRLGGITTFAIVYQGHHPVQTSFPPSTAPSDGIIGRVELNTVSPAGSYEKLRALPSIASGLETVLGTAGHRLVNKLADDELTLADLNGVPYGGRGTLNEANLGFYCGHGVFGLESDFTISASGPRQTYTPIWRTGNNFYDWFRISNGDFGGSFRDKNGVTRPGKMRWMCMLSCNNLQTDCYDDMFNKEVLPITDDLHLFLGCATSSFMVSNFGAKFGQPLTGFFPTESQQLTIPEAWFFAGTESQGLPRPRPSFAVLFRVAGWPNNFSDRIDNFQSPESGNPADITFQEAAVFTP